jgi:hypothetical protein
VQPSQQSILGYPVIDVQGPGRRAICDQPISLSPDSALVIFVQVVSSRIHTDGLGYNARLRRWRIIDVLDVSVSPPSREATPEIQMCRY